MVAEPNESHYGILRLPVNCGTADMFAKWPILAEKASLRRVNAAWLSRSERRAYAYSTLRPPTFSGDSLASACSGREAARCFDAGAIIFPILPYREFRIFAEPASVPKAEKNAHLPI